MAQDHATTLRKLGQALLNATLLLALALAVAGIVLINKVQNFAGDTASAVRAGIGTTIIEDLTESLHAVEQAVEDLQGLAVQMREAGSAAPAEVEALRGELRGLASSVAGLRAKIDRTGDEAAREISARLFGIMTVMVGLADQMDQPRGIPRD